MRKYKEYKTSNILWIKELPLEWTELRVKYFSIFRNGYAFKSTDFFDDEKYPVIRIGDLQDGKIDIDGAMRVSEEVYQSVLKFTNKRGDILLALTGATIGKSAIYSTDEISLLNQRVAALRPNKKAEIDFLKYLIEAPEFRTLIDFESYGGAQENIGKGQITSAKFPIPNIKEQKQIVRFLDFKIKIIDEFISNRQKQIDLLKEQLRKKIFTALTKGLSNKNFKPSELPWFTEIPVNWEMYKFNAAIKLLHGFQFRDNHFKEEGAKVAKITQLKADGSLDLSEASLVDEKFLVTLKKKIIKNGDILMALTGGTIGKIIRVENLEEDVLQNYRVGKFVPKDTRTLDKDYMFWVLSSEFTFAQILFLQRETGQPNIGIGDFSKMFFPMPNTLEEQREIASYIAEQKNETNSLISKYQKQIDLMQEYRTAIISQAVTGKIDVRDWQPKTKEIIS